MLNIYQNLSAEWARFAQHRRQSCPHDMMIIAAQHGATHNMTAYHPWDVIHGGGVLSHLEHWFMPSMLLSEVFLSICFFSFSGPRKGKRASFGRFRREMTLQHGWSSPLGWQMSCRWGFANLSLNTTSGRGGWRNGELWEKSLQLARRKSLISGASTSSRRWSSTRARRESCCRHQRLPKIAFVSSCTYQRILRSFSSAPAVGHPID